jgi:hypothetical protein
MAGRPKEILTGGNTVAVQGEIPGTERKRITAIEDAAAKADTKRSLIGGLGDELKNLVAKLSEVMHEHEGELDQEENEKGERVIVYKRGDFNVVVKYSETVNYKVRQESKGDTAPGSDNDHAE